MTTIKETATALGETVLAAKGAVQGMRRSASNMLDQARVDTSASLHSAASAVRSAGNQGAEVIEGVAEGTGQRLASASSYLDSHDAEGMLQDLRRIVRRHPGSFLLLTATVACTIGYMTANKTKCSRA